MALKIEREKNFIKNFNKIRLNDTEFQRFISYISLLSEGKELPKEARDHQLLGEYAKYREFHIASDMLVIYKIENEILYLVRIGTHAQLFK
ncbi:type II toxin-antitoxin system mRNA interferase toxin, RelE/StbE family [Campylobacter sp. MIT 99-7217]|uniref:type II toxin-antitoxin system RelE/ParE family toxin n=1 Tax=Campylobacter sp. MIT 99-7217 TaxID=535091 RepID=UPI001159C1F2|nr:type II toxin-antitoxin system YafQ family toxin [Campylobacter sp. MIT 99-7217]TQR33106.1 type II toxin-antitoxin system mRNA interferase toxin, RelE/StbE family [Campylobacter sp. MIT 99-7217]